MIETLTLLASYAGLLALALALARLMIPLGAKWRLIDKPDARRIHTTSIPRAGGIAVFVTMLAGFGVLWLIGKGFQGPLGGTWLAYFLASSSLLVGLGIIDDRWQLSAWTKLVFQIVAATVMFSQSSTGIGQMFGTQVPWWVDWGVHVVWTVALINAYNLIDGMDGLCAGLGLISLVILGVLAAVGREPENALVIAVMAVAVTGFLRYNFFPARIFLGDAGSMLIGFFIASVGSATVGRQAATSGVLLPALVAAVPLFDVFLAVWRRSARHLARVGLASNKAGVFDPDRDHLHHRLLDSGFSQRQAVGMIYGLALLISVIALLPFLGGANLMALSLIGIIVVGLIGLHYIAPVEFAETGRGLRAMIRRPQRAHRVVWLYFTFDVIALPLAMILSLWLVARTMITPFALGDHLREIIVFTACGMMALAVGRAHVRRWMRAGVNDFMECILWLTAGTAMSAGILCALDQDVSYRFILTHLCALALAGGAIFAFRGIGLTLLEGVVDSMHRRKRLRTPHQPQRTILYGAGDLGELFVCHLRLSPPEQWSGHQIIGFVDDAAELKGRKLRGFPILGTSHELKEIVTRTKATALFVTVTLSRFDERQWQRLSDVCRECSLQLLLWNPGLDPVPVPLSPPAQEKPAGTIATPAEIARKEDVAVATVMTPRSPVPITKDSLDVAETQS